MCDRAWVLAGFSTKCMWFHFSETVVVVGNTTRPGWEGSGLGDMDKFLNQWMRVTITDGRTVEGVLKCVDNSLNLIMADTKLVQDGQALGTVIIPGEHVVKCEIGEDEE